MAERQIHLFDPPKPLLRRFGEDFFRAVPRGPGVYIMTGPDERVLYVGHSGNLRARLGSYKNARPDRAPRRVIHLVRLVESITWEKCEDAKTARLRENELLRLHRPKFNAVNTYPRAYTFISLGREGGEVELGRTTEPPAGETAGVECYGAFKTQALAGYAALVRLAWAAVHQPATPQDFPPRILSERPPRVYRLRFPANPTGLCPEALLAALRSFLEGGSEGLIELLGGALPSQEQPSPFLRALQARDLEVLGAFYRAGPQRNHKLRAGHGLSGLLILQEQLDDLLVAAS